MISWYLSLDIQIKINIIAIIVAIVIPVGISIFTLRQNNKIIREANRPTITIFIETIAITGRRQNYLVIKNFGNTSGRIDSIECSTDIKLICRKNPFEGMINTTLAPNQSIVTCCNTKNVEQEYNFTIKYSIGKRKFEDIVYINTKYISQLYHMQETTSNMSELEKTILNSTQELIKSKF